MSSEYSLPIKTYTNLWNADRKLYRFQDISLPMPISFRQLGLFGAAALLWFPIMILIRMPITTAWGAIIWFAVPVGMAALGDKPIFGGKTVVQAILTWIRFFLTPGEYKDMIPVSSKEKEGEYSAVAKIWTTRDEYEKSFSRPSTAFIDGSEFFDKKNTTQQDINMFFNGTTTLPGRRK